MTLLDLLEGCIVLFSITVAMLVGFAFGIFLINCAYRLFTGKWYEV